MNSLAPRPPKVGNVTFVTVSIWYSLDSFNSSLKAFGVIVMNRKPFRKKDIKKSLVAGTDGDEGYRADTTGSWEPQGKVARFPGNNGSLCFVK